MTPQPLARTRRTSRLLAGLVAVLLLGVLSGCGLRLETAPPTEPVPDATELLRRTAVTDALGVATLADAARQTKGEASAVTTELERVSKDSHAQAEALGGPYVSGLPSDPSVLPKPVHATPAEVVRALVDAAGRSRTAASTTTDGDLARLVASIGASQTVSATRLATAAGLEAPKAVPVAVPPPGAATASPSPEPTGSPTPGAVATTAPGDEPTVPPAGLTASDYQALVVAEDGARYGLEVWAARSSGAERERLLARSVVHGTRAQAWAELARIADTDQDPRRIAYVLPPGKDAKALVQAIEEGLATDYASLVGTTEAGTRGVLVDLLVDAALTRNAWGGVPLTFPGLPERAKAAG
ncbi:MAG: DUF4439 domain-containing protein [Promicromonosporaceae bacterium]|nr:DUF4439 domain-containing protein [Promicromonosporaceae bacterium]